MAKLKTDFKDDIYSGARKYTQVKNDDNTISMIDVTDYTQEGDRFGANEINGTNQTVNELQTEMETVKKSVSDGKKLVAGAITGKGQATAVDAEFGVMAENIKKIVTKSVLTGNAAAGQVLAGKTFYNTNPDQKLTGTMATQGGSTTVPGTANKTVVAANRYVTGNIVVAGSPNLTAANIKKGVNIFGVTGTWEGYVAELNDVYSNGLTSPKAGEWFVSPIAGSVDFQTNQIVFSGKKGQQNPQIVIVTGNKFDLTNYSKVRLSFIDYMLAHSDDTMHRIDLVIKKTKDRYVSGEIQTGMAIKGMVTGNTYTIELNTKTLSTDYYIAVHMFVPSSTVGVGNQLIGIKRIQLVP